MYKLVFLPIAKIDMDNIVYYVSHNLNNKRAAEKLANDFIKGANNILYFPFGSTPYHTSKKLNYVHRSIKINNFLMFYTINDYNKIITVTRVLYKKMNINCILE